MNKGVEIWFHSFLIWTLDGGELSELLSGRFNPQENRKSVPTKYKIGWGPE